MVADWLNSYLSETSIEKIESTIAEVEATTAGEVVPMIVRSSSTVGHVPVVIYLSGLLLFFITGVQDSLSHELETTWWLIFVWAVFMIPVTSVLSKAPWVQRLLISEMDRSQQVHQRAMNEFYLANLNKTDGSTGILIFVSLMERQAVVLGDSAISEKLEASVWDEVIAILLQGIKERDMEKGLKGAILKSGELLTEHFPIKADDQNELPNKLIVKE